MANHMLYHVENIPRTAREAYRILRPGGRFLATTNSRLGMPEMHELHIATMQALSIPYDPAKQDPFALENGKAYLEGVFPRVSLLEYEGGFRAPDPEPIVAYYKATQLFQGPFNDEALEPDRRRVIEPTFRRLAAEATRNHGGELVVRKPVGGFVGK